MTGPPSGAPTIIIKKKRKAAAAAHHGGAWKVAYADFVTAMMAFFLLMWLLNATTEDQRKGLADYFNPSIPISKISGGGNGALNGSSLLSEDTLIRDGAGATEQYPKSERFEADTSEAAEAEKLRAIEEVINNQKSASMNEDLAKHIQTRMTPDGLVIELVDADGAPLYPAGSSAPSTLLETLLSVIAPVLATVSNDMAIVGHTDAHSYANTARYSNWELSADRALAARRLLITSGIPHSQIAEVTGKADTEPISDDAYAPQNRRIAITLLRQ